MKPTISEEDKRTARDYLLPSTVIARYFGEDEAVVMIRTAESILANAISTARHEGFKAGHVATVEAMEKADDPTNTRTWRAGLATGIEAARSVQSPFEK